MTDQIPADKIRKIIAFYRDGASDRGGMILDALTGLLPPPPPPTLADMTEEERRACQWMQADVETWDRAVIVLASAGGGLTMMLDWKGHVAYEPHSKVTPRPDLPRLEWPGDTPAPSLPGGWRLADHKDYGRVVVTNTIPDPVGEVFFVAPAPGAMGNDWHFCKADEITYLDTGQEAADAVD